MTAHNRFMIDNKPICEAPSRLDFGEFVAADSSEHPEPMCIECQQLITAANKRAYEREMYEGLTIVQKEPRYHVDPNHWDVFIAGLALGSAFWITALLVVWAVFLRCG